MAYSMILQAKLEYLYSLVPRAAASGARSCLLCFHFRPTRHGTQVECEKREVVAYTTMMLPQAKTMLKQCAAYSRNCPHYNAEVDE